MNIYKMLILIKNNKTRELEDKTSEISNIKYIERQVAVTYLNTNKVYNYNPTNIRVLKDPKTINAEHLIVCVDGFPIRNSSLVLDFGNHIKIIDAEQRTEVYQRSRITFQKSCLNSEQPKAVFGYLKNLSKSVSVMDGGKTVLFDQYEKITKISEMSVLSTYLAGKPVSKYKTEDIPIYPFGMNLSQKKAVNAALQNSISIIEGPPGTGKTQTILNIIANVVAKGKTVGVVSGNNAATSNVQEKLEKSGYGFITTLLGNYDNKSVFFEHGQINILDLNKWRVEREQEKVMYEQLSNISKGLDVLLEDKNKVAKLKEEISKLEVEQNYFNDNYKGAYTPVLNFSFYRKWSSDAILSFITQFEGMVLTGKNEKFLGKSLLLFKYGIYKFKYVNDNLKNIVDSLKSDYYIRAIEERMQQVNSLERRLENKSYKDLMDQYTEVSSKLFKSALQSKYSKESRENYTIKSFKFNFKNFIQDYPVILSTTHSIMTSITENFLFDYIIIDEASQVDLVTASLALACCKNVVIVGDINQLSQIVPTDIEKISDELFYNISIGEVYNYSKYSIIASLMKLYEDKMAKTLLNEHYRCHPKIIGFCNEKFYDNQLVIMTEEKPEDSPLKIYKTAPGNHARKDISGDEKGWYNLRQIEVVKDEIINENKKIYKDYSNIGIISPYRKHVIETRRCIGISELEVDTVHKYQGREKNTIIFTTVANDINPFIDDPNLINVAVSRAVKELIVVTSNKLFKQHGTNIGDLIRYIEYNSLDEDIIESKKISVFDLLYSRYSDKLLKVMTSVKHVSEYKSENLMYSVIEEVLTYPEFNSFKSVIHIPLNSIVKDFTALTAEERAFAENPWTHVDFLIFNKLDKESVLVIEVDGYEYHQNSEKQKQRDALKDKILVQIDLPILRIATNESGEKEKLIMMLNDIIKKSGDV